MMAEESQKKVGDDKDSMSTWLSELCRRATFVSNSAGTIASTSSPKSMNSTHGKQLNEAVYLFHEPQDQVDVEIVFIHGLEFDGSKEGYWKTWLARDGTQDNCWPKTWLVEEFPQARILSLSYDASIQQTPTSGRMDLYILGESLVQQMTHFGRIGQQNCPVMFVCHSFGGLVAKQIVVTGSQNFQDDEEVQNLLHNLRAFHFYATPHVGVQDDVLPLNPSTSKGPCMSDLEVFCPEVGRLNSDFEKICQEPCNKWICYNVGETHATSHGRVVVPEASARQSGHRFLPMLASHFDVCRPQSKQDSSYLSLTKRISEVIKGHEEKQQLCLLELPKKLVGMDDIQSMICEKLRSISIIGLVGMGGIGKTTISKFVFNLQAKSYDKTCFLQDVRPDDLARFQRQLFKEICGEEVDSTTCVGEVELDRIQQCIMGRRILIVIDNARNSPTLEALQVPKFQRGLSSGSRVIVTCRNRQVLDDHIYKEGLKDVEIIDVELLNDAQALELFRYHAFHGIEDAHDELKAFEDLAMKVAKACCGLPLSLEVIGQYLRKHVHSIGTQEEIWKEALKTLEEAQPFDGGHENEVLWKRLKISYDDLDIKRKRMFLDFACFFCEKSCSLRDQSIGWIWDSPTGLEILRERSLIKIGEFNEWRLSYTIHDQLRDMGRRIVKDLSLKRSRESLEKVTRLWEFDDIERFLEDDKGSTTIEGISLQECESRLVALPSQANPNVKGEMTIQRFHSLRLLNLRKCRIEVVAFFLRKCWKELSWLSLDAIQDKVIPQAIEAIGFCTGLRVLQVRDCSNLEELPASIGKLVQLLELDLTRCKRLWSLPDEIGYLEQLKRLELCGCETLKEVPSCVSQLTRLEYLGLMECSSLESMVEFERQMHHLIELDLYGCSNLQGQFKSLGKLHKLQILNLEFCDDLEIDNPSESFRQLSQLEKLNLRDCYNFIPKLCLHYSIGEVTAEEVERLWNPVVKNFSSSLRELDLPSISRVGFPMCTNLNDLQFHNRFHLEELPECLGDLTQLRSLAVRDAYLGYLKKLPTSLSRLVNLETLCLDSMLKLEGLPDIFGQLCSLKRLEICGMRKVEELPSSLGQLCSLKWLEIRGMRKVEELPSSLGQLIQLEHLEIKFCEKLKRLPISFTNLTQLSTLNLVGCDALEVMDASQELFLQELKQRGCSISLRRLDEDSREDDNEDTLLSEI